VPIRVLVLAAACGGSRAHVEPAVAPATTAANPPPAVSAASPPPAGRASAVDAAITGFYATGSGNVSGRASDADGKPLGGVEVHVISKSGGERVVTADKDGNYAIVLTGAPSETSMIFVRGHPGAHIGGVVAESVKVDGAEGIDIHETLPPTIVAKPITSTRAIPGYSAEAKAADVWARAWMMLDIDDKGFVQHVKMINRAGYGLDEIAIGAAFRLLFEPARDRANRPVSSMLLWTYEWPSYSWLNENNWNTITIPANVSSVPCKLDGTHRPRVRDCTQPDLRGALDEPWLSPKR
jgi:hypothetical protein